MIAAVQSSIMDVAERPVAAAHVDATTGSNASDNGLSL